MLARTRGRACERWVGRAGSRPSPPRSREKIRGLLRQCRLRAEPPLAPRLNHPPAVRTRSADSSTSAVDVGAQTGESSPSGAKPARRYASCSASWSSAQARGWSANNAQICARPRPANRLLFQIASEDPVIVATPRRRRVSGRQIPPAIELVRRRQGLNQQPAAVPQLFAPESAGYARGPCSSGALAGAPTRIAYGCRRREALASASVFRQERVQPFPGASSRRRRGASGALATARRRVTARCPSALPDGIIVNRTPTGASSRQPRLPRSGPAQQHRGTSARRAARPLARRSDA